MRFAVAFIHALGCVVTAIGTAGCAERAPAPAVPPSAPVSASSDIQSEGSTAVVDAPASDPLPAWMTDAAAKITAHAKGKTRAWTRLAEMSDRFGHRLSGSKALEDAIDWTVRTMTADGLVNVHEERVMVPHWVRGEESLKLISPLQRDLVLLGLGMSVGTKGVLRAEVAVVDHVDEIAKQPPGAFEGKIVLINQKMPPFDQERHDSHYGSAVEPRVRGASEAAKKGAVGLLIRSVTAHSLRTPHTGSLRYEDGVAKIPAAALPSADAELLARMARRGPVKVALRMGAKMLADAPSANVIAELRGREKPDEIVLIGGHIDSWDVGDGASDDGAGCLMAMEAALMLKELGLVPRRTIRVVLFTNEENGLRGAQAYFEAHGRELHAAAIEADSGSAAPRGFSIAAKDEAQVRELQRYAPLFRELGAHHIQAGWGGADISPLTERGVLGLAVWPDGSRYFDLHHSPADTVDEIDPAHLQGNAAAMALMAYLLAERE